MSGNCGKADRRIMTRRELLKIGGAGVAGTVLLGAYGCGAGAGSGGEGGGGAGPGLTVEHDAGRTALKGTARRVVAISDETVDLFVALGVEPLGMASSRVRGELGDRIGDSYYADLGDAVYLGDTAEPSVERIAALDPQLVVMESTDAIGLYDRLSSIAPTLSYDVVAPGWWRRPLADVGRVTGRGGAARRFVAEYDSLVEELRDRVAYLAETSPRLTLLYSPDAATTFVFDERSAPADPYAKLGFDLVVPDGVRVPAAGLVQISPEALSDLSTDTIVVLREVSERLPLDGILKAMERGDGGPRVLWQSLDPTRPSSSPVADRQAIEQAAKLLLEGGNR